MNPKLKQAMKRIREDTQAVSPVVATLLLVLVAAGAAIGFGVFLNGFQDGAQSNVNSDLPTQTLRIGGSSTVFEFSKVAVAGFENANPGIVVDLQSGGSGAGKAGVCMGTIDIGSSSSPVDADGKPGQDLETCPDFDGDGIRDLGQELNIVKVANDGVVFVTLPSNAHCDDPATTTVKEVPVLTRNNALGLYFWNAQESGSSSTFATAPNTAEDLEGDSGLTAVDGFTNDPDAVQWGEIVNSAGDQCTYDLLNEVVEIFDRSDQGGTSEVFTQKILGFKSPIAQLEDAGVTLGGANQGEGNQGVLDAVEDHARADHAMFFTSFGYASTEGLTVAKFGVTDPIAPSVGNIKSNDYDGSRPILYITAGEPSAIEQLWLDWVTATTNNIHFSDEADFISIYA